MPVMLIHLLYFLLGNFILQRYVVIMVIRFCALGRKWNGGLLRKLWRWNVGSNMCMTNLVQSRFMCKVQRVSVLSLAEFGTGGDMQGAHLAWKLPIVPTLEYSAHICSCNSVSTQREERCATLQHVRRIHTGIQPRNDQRSESQQG